MQFFIKNGGRKPSWTEKVSRSNFFISEGWRFPAPIMRGETFDFEGLAPRR